MRLFKSNVASLQKKRNIDGLINALKDPDEQIREAARLALLGLGRETIDKLIPAIDHESFWIRGYAAWILYDLGSDPRAIPSLSRKAQTDYYPFVRKNCTYALWKTRDLQVIGSLCRILEDRDQEVRDAAYAGLIQFGSASVDPLTAVLSSPNIMERRYAIWALGNIGDPAAIRPIMAALKDYDNTRDYNFMIGALKALGHLKAVEGIPFLISYLDAEQEKSKEARIALEAIISAHGVHPLIEVFKSSSSSDALKIVDILARTNCVPEDDRSQTILHFTKGNWQAIQKIGKAAIPFLLDMISQNLFLKEQQYTAIIETLDAIGGGKEVGQKLFDDLWIDQNQGFLKLAFFQTNGEAKLEFLRISLTQPTDLWSDNRYILIENLLNSLHQINDLDFLSTLKDYVLNSDNGRIIQGAFVVLTRQPGIDIIGDILARVPVPAHLIRLCIDAGDKRLREQAIHELFSGYWSESPAVNSYQSLFGDATEMIIDAAYGVRQYVRSSSVNDFIGADEETYGYDTSKKEAAVDRICEINTPVSCNLLHKVMGLKNMNVMDAAGYYYGGASYKDLDFGYLRERARAELEKRGNPPYDPAVYLVEDYWNLG